MSAAKKPTVASLELRIVVLEQLLAEAFATASAHAEDLLKAIEPQIIIAVAEGIRAIRETQPAAPAAPKAEKPAYVKPQWQLDRLAAMEAAKAAAMSGKGSVVAVFS